MYNSRAQIGIFIVIGTIVVIVSVFSYFIFFNGSESEKIASDQSLGSSDDIMFHNVHNYVDDCVDNSLRRTVIDISLKGGYYTLNFDEGIVYDEIVYPYYFDGENITYPSIEEVNDEFSSAMVDNMVNCMLAMDNLDYDVSVKVSEFDKKSIDLDINDGVIDASVDIPINVIYGDETKSYSNFKGSVKHNLLDFLNISSEIAKFHSKNPGYFPMGLMIDFASKNNFTFNMYPLVNEEDVLMIISFDDLPGGDMNTFVFGLKYPMGYNEEEVFIG